MNTTLYGEEFEKKVYSYFENMLSSDQLPGASSKRSKIFYHKPYYDRNGRKYIFDCTIETYFSQMHEDREDWSNLIVIECKRYGKTVDIADLDEFEGKLLKLSPFGIKGYFVTTSGFSQTAINQARNLHYGLIVCDENDKWDWLVTRDTRRDKSEMYLPILLGETPVGRVPLAFSDGIYYNIYDLLVNDGVVVPLRKTIKAPMISKENIRKLAMKLYTKNVGIDSDIPGHLLYRLYPDFKITFARMPVGILGYTSFKKRVISLSEELVTNPQRLKFTLAHELGHILLHGNILAEYEMAHEGLQTFPIPQVEQRWFDYHANKFASYILLPSPVFERCVMTVFKHCNVNGLRLVIDHQPFKNGLRLDILRRLAALFNVSMAVIEIRLEEDGFFQNMTKQPSRISSILNGY